jgi:hypothetical protein
MTTRSNKAQLEANLRRERDKYNDTDGDYDLAHVLEAMDAFLDAEQLSSKELTTAMRQAYRELPTDYAPSDHEFLAAAEAFLAVVGALYRETE